MKTFFVQARGENLRRNLKNIIQQTVQLINVGNFKYEDLLCMEIKDREEHYRTLIDLKNKESESMNNIGQFKKGFSRFK